MAATTTAMYQINLGSSTVATAFPQPPGTADNLDLLQIVRADGSCLLNVDYAGTVHKPASGNTNGTRVGVFQTNLTSASSTAQLVANAFSNPSLIDILQVINPGGTIHYYLDYLGVAHGS